jgi:hopanoid biosynthesis associated protein HpnK
VSRRLIVCVDDFGLDIAVNEAVEAASRDGILTCASLMVGAPAAADAVARAHRLPALRVGLHVVLVDGRPMLPPHDIPALVGRDGRFDDNMLRAGIRLFADPAARRQLAAEIRAQFQAFAATGLSLDHVNAHKHFHLHPTIAQLIVKIGRDYGLKAMRVPWEPPALLRRAAPDERPGIAAALYAPYAAMLRRRLQRAGLAVNERLLGLAWTGAITEARLLQFIAVMPEGVSELYCHAAVEQTTALRRAMPSYRPVDEFTALMSPTVRRALNDRDIGLVAYGDLATAA